MKLYIFFLVVGVLLGNIIMLIWMLLSNSDINLDSSKVTLYSGLLGFSGAIIAVVGTYIISTHQMKQQFKNDVMTRNKQILIERLEKLITIFIKIRLLALSIKKELKIGYKINDLETDFNYKIYISDSKEMLELKEFPDKLIEYIYLIRSISSEKKEDFYEEMDFVLIKLSDSIAKLSIAMLDKKESAILAAYKKEELNGEIFLKSTKGLVESEEAINEILNLSGEWVYFLTTKLEKDISIEEKY